MRKLSRASIGRLVTLGAALLLGPGLGLAEDSLPFGPGEGPCVTLRHRGRALEPVSEKPIRKIETVSPEGTSTLPVCAWNTDDWRQHAVGRVTVTISPTTATAIGGSVDPRFTTFSTYGLRPRDQSFIPLEFVKSTKGTTTLRVRVIAEREGEAGVVAAKAITLIQAGGFGLAAVVNEQATRLPE